MHDAQANSEMTTRRRTQRLKEVVLAAFSSERPEVSASLGEFSARDWQKTLFWLDASGLALYLVDRLASLDLLHSLPEVILARLQQNLRDNRERTDVLIKESIAVGTALQQQDISFALLKGVTLAPESVPDTALRCQLDLDFLVAENDAGAAKNILLRLGYRLHAVCGNTLEFKAGMSTTPDLKMLYQTRPQRSLELHLLPAAANGIHPAQLDRLARAQLRSFQGKLLPALSPADLFLQQALHLFKHICGEHTRASWVLEFWRHIQARRGDVTFWDEVESLAEAEGQANIAVGAVTLLATRTFGEIAPPQLSRWTTDPLPPAVRLWIETYGKRALLTDFPGTKLYLLLRGHLRPGDVGRRASLRSLVPPLRLPPRITHRGAAESLPARLRRFFIEARFVLFRLRFHLVEGLRYAVESSRWQRRLTGITH
jgi:hypothetical protein